MIVAHENDILSRTGARPSRLRPSGGASSGRSQYGLPAYHETQKEVNVTIYEKFGFKVTEEINLPMNGPRLWLMWRDPKSAGSVEPAH